LSFEPVGLADKTVQALDMQSSHCEGGT